MESIFKEPPKSSSFILTLQVCLIIVGLFAGGILYQVVQDGLTYGQLTQLVSEQNKKLPMMVDASTRWDSYSIEGKTVNYKYTIVIFKKSELNLDNFKSKMMPKLISIYSTDPRLEYFRDNQYNFKCSYSDSTGEHIIDLDVGPSDVK